MKKFENVSEREILNAAWIYFSEQYLSECEFLENHPTNEPAKVNKAKLRKITDELHDALFCSKNK